MRWRPNLSVFEHRLDLLKRWQARGRMHGFRVGDAEVGALLHVSSNPADLLQVDLWSEGVRFLLRSDGEDLGEVRARLLEVFEALAPLSIVRVQLRLQMLTPLQAKYEDARAALAATSIGQWFGTGTAPTDFAFLIDGGSAETGVFQVELGVVDAQEARVRLAREIGRVPPLRGLDSPGMAAPLARFEGLPEVSLYTDWSWNRQLREPTTIEPIVQFWDQALDESYGVAQRVAGNPAVAPAVNGG